MTTEDFLKVAQPIIDEHNLFLVELKISKLNDIELLVDAMEGVNISTCIEISRAIESHFDREVEDFSLTVASAGIGYPFKVAQQYLKNIDKPIEIKFTDHSKLSAILRAFDGNNITIEYQKKVVPEGKKRKELVTLNETISLENVKEIRDEVIF